MLNKFTILLLGLGILISLGFSIYNFNSVQKIGYVDNSVLISGYNGVKEGDKSLQEERVKWQNNLDTLAAEVDRLLENYHKSLPELSESDKVKLEQFIQKKQQSYFDYKESMDEQLSDAEAKLSVGVINQINSFVKDYGIGNNYDLIIGVNSDGNLLHGNKKFDITDEILAKLNSNYEGND